MKKLISLIVCVFMAMVFIMPVSAQEVDKELVYCIYDEDGNYLESNPKDCIPPITVFDFKPPVG